MSALYSRSTSAGSRGGGGGHSQRFKSEIGSERSSQRPPALPHGLARTSAFLLAFRALAEDIAICFEDFALSIVHW
jgi:hypothetical protein